MSISENKLVVQHNKIVEARYRLSVGEQRIIKLLISMIKKDDKDFKAYKISVKQLSELLEITDNDFHRKIKAISKKLLSNVLTFKNIDDDEELQVSWLSSAKYIGKEGIAICMEGFGLSAPAADLAEEFGFTVDAILERILAK